MKPSHQVAGGRVINKHLATYLDGLDACVDGRGFGAEHERARLFVETACDVYAAILKTEGRKCEHSPKTK